MAGWWDGRSLYDPLTYHRVGSVVLVNGHFGHDGHLRIDNKRMKVNGQITIRSTLW